MARRSNGLILGKGRRGRQKFLGGMAERRDEFEINDCARRKGGYVFWPKMKNLSEEVHLNLGGLLFPRMDQTDFTGPFEVLSRLPNSTFHVIGKTTKPVADIKGLVLVPQVAMADAPQLDLLVVPGGEGVNEVMEDEETLAFIRKQASRARVIFSVCTGALTCGAAGLLKGRRATTHWASFHLLEFFGAIPVNERVVTDGNLVCAAGVTAGIDGALTIAAMLRGDFAAQRIQLQMQYAPEPPFRSGTPETAPAEAVQAQRAALAGTLEARMKIIQRVVAKQGTAGG
jgi:cyclohexyl-isocyanide hydratase